MARPVIYEISTCETREIFPCSAQIVVNEPGKVFPDAVACPTLGNQCCKLEGVGIRALDKNAALCTVYEEPVENYSMRRRSPVEVEVQQREERREDGYRRQAVQARCQSPPLPVEDVVY